MTPPDVPKVTTADLLEHFIAQRTEIQDPLERLPYDPLHWGVGYFCVYSLGCVPWLEMTRLTILPRVAGEWNRAGRPLIGRRVPRPDFHFRYRAENET